MTNNNLKVKPKKDSGKLAVGLGWEYYVGKYNEQKALPANQRNTPYYNNLKKMMQKGPGQLPKA